MVCQCQLIYYSLYVIAHSLFEHWREIEPKSRSKFLTFPWSQYDVCVYAITCHYFSHCHLNNYSVTTWFSHELRPPNELIDSRCRHDGAWIMPPNVWSVSGSASWNWPPKVKMPQCLLIDKNPCILTGYRPHTKWTLSLSKPLIVPDSAMSAAQDAFSPMAEFGSKEVMFSLNSCIDNHSAMQKSPPGLLGWKVHYPSSGNLGFIDKTLHKKVFCLKYLTKSEMYSSLCFVHSQWCSW